MSRISTHVLDTARGQPAAGVPVALECGGTAGAWTEIARGVTDADGRIADLHANGALPAGDYRLRFGTAAYAQAQGQTVFYPEVVIHVRLDGSGGRYHLPLLLCPFGYSTYRGS